MRKISILSLCFMACLVPSAAQDQGAAPMKLLDHLAGDWVLKGTIGGQRTTHDVEARWILGHEYLQIHEVSREKGSKGEPAYEAIVLLGWDRKAQEYVCLWLDSTSGAGLSSGVMGRGKESGDSIPFVFTLSPSESIHTTFAYRHASDRWQWIIDDVTNGKPDRFADVELSRAK
jgi:hypothetical protein